MIGFIDDNRAAYGVEPICKVLPIAPSTYHARVARRADPAKASSRARRDVGLRAEIRRVFEAIIMSEEPALTFGHTYGFMPGADGNQFLADGFSGPENWRRWTDAKRALCSSRYPQRPSRLSPSQSRLDHCRPR